MEGGDIPAPEPGCCALVETEQAANPKLTAKAIKVVHERDGILSSYK